MRSNYFMGVGAVLVGLLIAASAGAQEAVHFRQQVKAGDTIDFNQQSDMRMSFDISANGQVMQQVQQKMLNTRVGRMEVLEVNEGKPVKIRVSYAPTSGGRMEAMGQQQQVPFGAAGQTVTVTRQNGMTVIDHDGNLDEATQQELTALLDTDDSLFPDRPLRVGEAFEVDAQALKEAFEMQEGQATARGTVLAVRDVNGRRQAQVRIEADINATVEGFMQIGLKLQGDSWFDVETSRPVEATMQGPMTVSGQMNQQMQPGGPAVPMQVRGGGQVSYTEKGAFNAGGAGPAGGGAAGPGDGQADGMGNIPGFGPGSGGEQVGGAHIGNGGGAPNPFETAPKGNPLTGQYSGHGMELEIRADGSGTITMGGARAQIVGLDQDPSGTGKGRFQVDGGGTFDFTIWRSSPDTVVFRTGQSSYALQRAAAAKPANPFDQ